jgi:LPXTG-motif cell wall-anchored protein
MTRILLCIAALLCALAPSAALAQGAGDEQYQDPFGDEQAQSEPTPTATPAPAQSAPAPTATPGTAQAPAQPTPAPAPASAAQLPRTGADAGWLALAGAVLLAAGIALRRRADHQR